MKSLRLAPIELSKLNTGGNKIMKKKGLLISLVLVSVASIIINIVQYDNTQNQNNDNIDKATYEEYQMFCNYVSENLKIEGLENKYSSKQDNIIVIEPEWSFNKRNTLRLNESMEIVTPTIEMYVYEDHEANCLIQINICYLENYIGNDLHSYIGNNSDLDVNSELAFCATSATISYRNILIVIQQARNNSCKDNYLNSSLVQITKLATEYFK